MDQVDVYVNDHYIYNLEDMSLLGKLPQKGFMTLYNYFISFKEKHPIQLAVIGLNQELRDAIYCVFPKSFIIIHPVDVMKMIQQHLACAFPINEGQEEMAAGMEAGFQDFYYHQSKGEAINCYKQWQGDVPLGIKCFHDIINTIDYYDEEIFNYFGYENIFHGEILRDRARGL